MRQRKPAYCIFIQFRDNPDGHWSTAKLWKKYHSRGTRQKALAMLEQANSDLIRYTVRDLPDSSALK